MTVAVLLEQTVPRRVTTLAAAVAGLVLLTGLAVPAAAGASGTGKNRARAACPAVIVVGARGSGEAMSANTEGVGPEVDGFVASLRLYLGRSTTVRVDADVYPAVAISPTLTITSSFATSVQDGTVAADALVAKDVASCPASSIVLAGYSQGAEVVHQAALGLTRARGRHVAAIALLSDPLRDTADSTAANELTDDYSGAPHGDGVFGARLLPSWARGKAAQFCTVLDAVCNYTPAVLAYDDAVGFAPHLRNYAPQSAASLAAAAWAGAEILG